METRRLNIFILSVILLVDGLSWSATIPELSDSVVHYHFDEGGGDTVSDRVGPVNSTGTLYGGAVWVATPWGTGLEFTGATLPHVEISTGLFNNMPGGGSERTISLWVKNILPMRNQQKVLWRYGCNSAGNNVMMLLETSGYFRLSAAGLGANTAEFSTTISPSTNTWQMLTFVKTTGTTSEVIIYLDGTERDRATKLGINTITSGFTGCPGVVFKIGSEQSANTECHCQIDEFVVSTRAWSAGEISHYYKLMRGQMSYASD